MAAAGIGGAGSSGLFRHNYIYVPSAEGFETADFSYTFFAYLLEDAESRCALCGLKECTNSNTGLASGQPISSTTSSVR